METPSYRGQPINSVEVLAALYNFPPQMLNRTIQRATTYYRPLTPVDKGNGKVRQLYSVRWPLSRLQRQTVDLIFYNVNFPSYLKGSLRAENEIPRDYIADAALHAQYRIIMRFDIADFFPSIGSGLVFSIWRDFFRFPDLVSRTLTKATTYKGFVPQGAATSSYIANLVFWDREPQLQALLAEKGFFYTRYVDDINISSNEKLDKSTIEYITEQVYRMLRSRGFKPNRKKMRVQTRRKQKMIHNLNIGAGVPTKPKRIRSKIRAAVKQCEDMAQTVRSGDEYEKLYASTLGRVIDMKRLHENEANRLLQRLDSIQPISIVQN